MNLKLQTMFDKNNKNQLLDEHLTDVLDERTTVDRYIWVRALGFFVVSVLLGVLCGLYRLYVGGEVHIEAFAGLIILIGLNIGLIKYFMRNKRKWYKFAYLLSVCAIWGGDTIGWRIGVGYYFNDMFMVNGVLTLISLGIGYLVFYIADE
jgi:hypothetical protein